MDDNKDSQNEYDSFKDVVEFQNNMYNPGYYVGTGKVSPALSAPGNATPWAVTCFIAAIIFCGFGLFLFFSDVRVTFSGLIESDIANKIIILIIMMAIAMFFLLMGIAYLKKAKKYYRKKAILESEPVDETVEDKMWQRTCPECGTSHDIDYPKCPNCRFNYLE